MGKSRSKKKKRSATQALYEAAARASSNSSREPHHKRFKLETIAEQESQQDASAPAPSSSNPAANSFLDKHRQGKNGDFGDNAREHDIDGISDSDLAVTIRTLQRLSSSLSAQHGGDENERIVTVKKEVFHSKRYKELRRSLHPFILEQMHSYDKGIDYKARTTQLLQNGKWSDALSSLKGSLDFEQIPKQGTIQRWVRCVDACNSGSVKLQLLSSILKLQQRQPEPQKSQTRENGNSGDDADGNVVDFARGDLAVNKHDPRMALIEAQKELKQLEAANGQQGEHSTDTEGVLEILQPWSIPSTKPEEVKFGPTAAPLLRTEPIKSQIIYQEKAELRKPPNHYDLLLHYISDGDRKVRFHANFTNQVAKHMVPFVPGGFVLENVLSSDECDQLRALATGLGYRLDHPVSMEQPTGIDSCEWLINDSIHAAIFDRVKGHLPSTMGSCTNGDAASTLHSINKRWRFFRYGTNCVYRPHIDGSWPESRLVVMDEGDDALKYECDESGTTRSYLTFLIYLNDDFDGGSTRYYYHDDGPNRQMIARGVQPKMGCVMVFPQGNTASLLHEGSAVTRGTKYVVRTDVLYSALGMNKHDPKLPLIRAHKPIKTA